MLTEKNPALHTYEGAKKVVLECTAKFMSKKLVELQVKEKELADLINQTKDYSEKISFRENLFLIQQDIKKTAEMLGKQVIRPNGCCRYVGLGNLVTIQFPGYKQKKLFVETIATGQKSLGIDSPLGKAILGKEVGDIVSYFTTKKTPQEALILKNEPYSKAKEFLKS